MSVDFDWIKDQFDRVECEQTTRWIVKELLTTLNNEAEKQNLTEPKIAEIVDVFSSLSKGHPIVSEKEEESPEKWVDVKPGYITMRDYVRVRNDAYSGSVGMEHNSQTGYVVVIRPGKVSVRYESSGEVVEHIATALEKRVV